MTHHRRQFVQIRRRPAARPRFPMRAFAQALEP
jgi:hypothetical protein